MRPFAARFLALVPLLVLSAGKEAPCPVLQVSNFTGKKLSDASPFAQLQSVRAGISAQEQSPMTVL